MTTHYLDDASADGMDPMLPALPIIDSGSKGVTLALISEHGFCRQRLSRLKSY